MSRVIRTVVVDDDIDPTNLNEVLWALCTRSDPVQDIEIHQEEYRCFVAFPLYVLAFSSWRR